MVGMFETEFQHVSSTALPQNVDIQTGLKIMHDFDTMIRLSPDCRGCKPIPPPPQKNGQVRTEGQAAEIQHYEVEDDLPFIPKRLWSGGVKYVADFLPTSDGCDITVHAPGGFTSINHWRILLETLPEDSAPQLERVQSKDLAHAQLSGSGWYVQIISDAKCNRTFASFVKGFLKSTHVTLQRAFIEKLQQTPAQQRSRRPTIGRRRSSEI